MMMGDDGKHFIEAIEEEAAEAAKAVVADVKSIAADVADAIAECKAELCGPSPSDPTPGEPAKHDDADKSAGQTDIRPDSANAS